MRKGRFWVDGFCSSGIFQMYLVPAVYALYSRWVIRVLGLLLPEPVCTVV